MKGLPIIMAAVILQSRANPGCADITVVSGSPIMSGTTAHYLFYGSSATVEAPAVYLNSESSCKPLRSVVEGKIVYTDTSGAPGCIDGDRYEWLVNAGAVGFV